MEKYYEISKQRETFLGRKWIVVNEKVAYRRIIICKIAVEFMETLQKNTRRKLDVNVIIKLVIYNCK